MLAAVSISFFTVAGTELHWRNVVLVGDPSSWSTLLTGFVSCLLVISGIFTASWIFQEAYYGVAGIALHILKWPFAFLWIRLSKLKFIYVYTKVPQADIESKDEELGLHAKEPLRPSRLILLPYSLTSIALLFLLALSIMRPSERSLVFMSWTLPLLPFVDFTHSSPTLGSLLPVYGSSINYDWDNRTALTEPIKWDWLPSTPLRGFEDWYEKYKDHYNGAEDPMKISNLADDLLPQLRNKLKDIKIRHVMLIKLESTRKDVFPFKKNGLIWDLLANSTKTGSIGQVAQERLASLTPTANLLTGDYQDGFGHDKRKRRGGLNFNNAFTTSTYTLKSLAGTLCGMSPLVADFNAERTHHAYQPCLPHIFSALNLINPDDDNNGNNFTSFRWRSSFMQSVTSFYDGQDLLLPQWGFADENIISKEYLQGDHPKLGNVTLDDVNYYGMPEEAIEDYVRDAFVIAKENNERVFLTHLTSTSHHPFAIPDDENYPYIPLSEDDKLDNLSHYLNSMGYVDHWLSKILGILENEGVADETLLVVVGDHGLSLPENGAVTPYYQPNVGNVHVPLVLSHPKLPTIDINDAVVSLQILPTLLDLLLETVSLSKSDTKVVRDLVRNYEGQSLLRPLRKEKDGVPNWQFTVLNPGRAELSVRDGRHPNWRLIVPVVENTEWRFTDVGLDPTEKFPIVSFSFNNILRLIEDKHSLDAAKWVEEAAFISRWWVEENSKRWQ